MSKILKFGEDVEGFDIPVLNEREIRAAAGILFLMMFIAIFFAGIQGDFLMLKYATTIFLTDILIRVLINPRYSPSLIIGRLIVSNQVPEYVGAAQKKFAWKIGIILALTIFIHLVVVNAFSPITGLICFICLVFLFFESAFGICLGCKFYPLFHKGEIRYCPGEVCDVKSRHQIQKTSAAQLIIVFGFIAYIYLTILFFNNNFRQQPYDLFGIQESAQLK